VGLKASLISSFVAAMATYHTGAAAMENKETVVDPQARYAGSAPVEACTEPGSGECTALRNMKTLVGNFTSVGGVSFSRAKLPDGRELWIKTWDVVTMDTDESLARKVKKKQQASVCDRKGGASIGDNAATILKSCWGKPKTINQTITARGRHEQWVYNGGYLYLENGVVTSIQTSR
jgi:hypothetical protein